MCFLQTYSFSQFAGTSYPILLTLNLLSWQTRNFACIEACMLVYMENDTPPLSYSADISDVFLVSFVSMMEHGCQFRDRNSDGCSIEFLFSGQRALQRTLSFTYLTVISPSYLLATGTAVLYSTSKPTDFSFSLAAQDDTPTQTVKYLTIYLSSSSSTFSHFPDRLIQLYVAFSSCYLLNS